MTSHKAKPRDKIVLDLKHNVELDHQLTQVVFACETCQAHFSSMSLLQEHTLSVHQNENPMVLLNNDNETVISDLDPSNFIIEFETS